MIKRKIFVFVLLFLGCTVFLMPLQIADTLTQGILKAQNRLNEVFRSAQTRRAGVVVHLENGQKYRALVKEVSTHAVVLTEPAGREFYDVYIPLEKIMAVEVRVKK